MRPPLHIVLYQPQIPPNTGNIARLCACTGCRLHLVQPLGFSLDDRHLRRAGLDYWQFVDVQEHADWTNLRHRLENGGNWFGFSTKAVSSLWHTRFQAGDVLVFGPETSGLPEAVLGELTPVTIPMRRDAAVRSLNLASAVAAAAFEALRQITCTAGA